MGDGNGELGTMLGLAAGLRQLSNEQQFMTVVQGYMGQGMSYTDAYARVVRETGYDPSKSGRWMKWFWIIPAMLFLGLLDGIYLTDRQDRAVAIVVNVILAFLFVLWRRSRRHA